MTIEEIEEKVGQIRRLRWLEEIKESYSNLIELIQREGRYFRITGIMYCARGDESRANINPHQTIDPNYLRDGLKDAVEGISKEIAELREEIEND